MHLSYTTFLLEKLSNCVADINGFQIVRLPFSITTNNIFCLKHIELCKDTSQRANRMTPGQNLMISWYGIPLGPPNNPCEGTTQKILTVSDLLIHSGHGGPKPSVSSLLHVTCAIISPKRCEISEWFPHKSYSGCQGLQHMKKAANFGQTGFYSVPFVKKSFHKIL